MFNYNGNKLQALPLWIYNALRQPKLFSKGNILQL